ncbi:hypothetical protein N2152v2_005768 [Parachlorella kessleri]
MEDRPPGLAGVPPEFNEYLPKDSEEYKKWKAATQSGAVEGQLEQLSIKDGGAAPAIEAELKQQGGKKKKKQKPEVVLERNTRNKKKCVTTITGLDQFGVKLSDASKLFGKKFASGASVTKNAEGKEQIDCQGDFLDQAVEVILKQWKEVKKCDIYFIADKKKQQYFDGEEDED